MAGKDMSRRFSQAKKGLRAMRKKVGKTGRGVLAGLAGAGLVLSGIGSAVKEKSSGFKDYLPGKKQSAEEGIIVKKSTVVAILVALAAVAGVLAALYFYVLRREKELDEYEQLLFSEDFNDDLLDEEPEPELEPEKA